MIRFLTSEMNLIQKYYRRAKLSTCMSKCDTCAHVSLCIAAIGVANTPRRAPLCRLCRHTLRHFMAQSSSETLASSKGYGAPLHIGHVCCSRHLKNNKTKSSQKLWGWHPSHGGAIKLSILNPFMITPLFIWIYFRVIWIFFRDIVVKSSRLPSHRHGSCVVTLLFPWLEARLLQPLKSDVRPVLSI